MTGGEDDSVHTHVNYRKGERCSEGAPVCDRALSIKKTRAMRLGGKSLVTAPPDGRALWLRHDGSSINLMASTCFVPAGLALPVDDCFEVRILRVDPVTKCLFVRPLCIDNQYDELNMSLSAAAEDSYRLAVPQLISMSTVYMIRTKKGYLRGVLLKREKAVTYPMYDIDLGEVINISANDIYELLPSLRDIPPLCLCVTLESHIKTRKCEEFAFLKQGAICIIKICNEFPSDYPQRAKEMYPPAIMSQIYEKSENGKFVEITCMKVRDRLYELFSQIVNFIIFYFVFQTNEKIPEASLIPTADEVRFSGNIGSSIANASVIVESVASRKVFYPANWIFVFRTSEFFRSFDFNILSHLQSISIGGGNSRDMPRRRCRALVVKSASLPAITRDPALPFMFQKFSVSLPTRLTARVTERIDYDTYLMRNPEVINDLTQRMVAAKTPLRSRLCLDRGICCIARLIRPARLNSSSFQPQIFRAIASHYRPNDNTCEVLLVDFGQTIVCSVSDLFELQDQPVEVLEKPTASFRCRVKRFSPPKGGNKGIRLLDENNYNVCLTLKCARDLYWAKVTLSDTDFVLYYKKPRARKEMDEKKSMKEEMHIDTASEVDVIRKLKQRKRELHEAEGRLHEQEESLRKEEKIFANESIKRDQELQLIALQMQLWDISAKLDVATSNNSSFVKADGFCPQLEEGNYCDAPLHTANDYSQYGDGYDNSSSAVNISQQQQNVALNQSWGQSSFVTPTNQCNRPYQQMLNLDFKKRTFTIVFLILLQHTFPEKWYFHPKKWQVVSPETTRRLSLHDNIFQPPVRPDSKNKKRSAHVQTTISKSKTNTINSNSNAARFFHFYVSDYKITVSTDSFWDSCHRKLEYGEPPHRTVSDYYDIAKKQSHEHSPSAVSQNKYNLLNYSNRHTTLLKLEHSRKAVGDRVVSDASYTSLIKKPIYTSDESDDYSQLCISTSSYGAQDMIYHKLVSIADGSELMVRRVGSNADWPVFFVIPTAALQDISAEYFHSLHPTQKLNANGIEVGVLCVAECNDSKKTKVRAIIERFNGDLVHVRHIDDGNLETISRNQLWSTENLSPSVRTQPALSVPCILASLNETQLVKTISCHMNEIPCVGQLMHVLFKERRNSDGIWIVELINEKNNDNEAE
uniref:Tudor domain-containing protein n=1 Tax=Elaeophora elaphi TaxID=1147741 RepID=A0A0R3S4W0_9BILA